MTTTNKNRILIIAALLIGGILILWHSFSKSDNTLQNNSPNTKILTDSISRIVSDSPGEIGVALIIGNNDTIAINNENVYPMMSVFKLHQALAVCHKLDNDGVSLDSVICVQRNELDDATWSPMLKEHLEAEIRLTICDLIKYALIQSDNNASNIMFDKLESVSRTDAYIATLIPRSSFKIAYSEAEMAANHDRAYSNHTSPLGVAELINRLFNEQLISHEKQQFIKQSLGQCITGIDRLVAPLSGKEGVKIAHKTGSGYRNESGELVAHNDVGYIQLPNGLNYSLAVFVKDFNGDEKQASEIIAHISAVVYNVLSQDVR